MVKASSSFRRRDLPTMTRNMMAVLIHLRAVQDADAPLVPLADVDPRTIRALFERDWIFASSGPNGDWYKITGRGLKALAVYEPQVKRNDGLCPRCGERPRPIRNTGVVAPYCRQCESRMSRREYRLGLHQPNPELPCHRCHKRPRYTASTGRVYTECHHCKNLRQRRRHRRDRRQLLARIVAGEHIACRKDNCSQPRYVTGNSVQDYCREHYSEYQKNYHRRQRSAALNSKNPN